MFISRMAGLTLLLSATAGLPGASIVYASSATASKCAAYLTAAHGSQASKSVTLSLKYDHTDIRAVLGAFAQYTGRTINVGKDVSGDVTTEIHDEPWEAALKSILTPLKLIACQDRTGTIAVDAAR